MALNDIAGKSAAAVAERAAVAAAAAAKKAATAAKKEAAAKEATDREAAFERCKYACVCGEGDACVAQALARCPTCKALKKKLLTGPRAGEADCRVVTCRGGTTEPAPLLLMGPQSA